MDIHAITTQQILEQISRHCPEALSAYLQCLNRANPEGSAFFSRDLIEVEMSDSFRVFRNQIKKLARENLLEWHSFDGGIHITLASASDEDE